MTGPADSNGGDPLDAVVAEYLQKAEAGTPPNRDALLAAHPELAERLREFFAALDALGAQGESFRLPDATLPPLIGDYELLEELGRGGTGVVYRARQKSLDRVVALKMILSGALADAMALRQFREQAEALSRLDHPRIVTLYDVGEYRGLPYITMKLIEGQSLSKCLARFGLDSRAVAAFMFKVCGAVDHAHNRNVLHRELTPENILIDDAGDPHVTGFGLTRLIEETHAPNGPRPVFGRVGYVAPEQAAGTSAPTVATDIYRLGAVLYTLLTREPPFQGSTVYETLRQVIEDEPVAPDRLVPGTPPALVAVCLKCLRKDPARRYATVAALADDLQRYLVAEPVRARLPGTLAGFAKRRRRPAAIALGTALAAALGLVIGTRTAQLNPAPRPTERAGTDGGKLGGGNAERDELVRALERKDYALAVATYTGQLARARWELESGDKAKALATLDGCPWDMRGWEFDHLVERCTSSEAAVTLRRRQEVTTALAFARVDGRNAIIRIGYDEARADRRGFIHTRLDGKEPEFVSGFDDMDGTGVTTLAVVPGGRFVCTGHANGEIKMWLPHGRTSYAEEVQRLTEHGEPVTSMAIAPDGRQLFVGNSLSVQVYPLPTEKVLLKTPERTDVPPGKALRRIATPFGRRSDSLVLSTDGQYLLHAGCLWDTREPNKLVQDFGKEFTGTAISGDAKRVAGLAAEPPKKEEVKKDDKQEKPGDQPPGWQGRPWAVHEVATGKALASSTEVAERVAFAPGGDWIVTARASRQRITHDGWRVGNYAFEVLYEPAQVPIQLHFHNDQTGALLAQCNLTVPAQILNPHLFSTNETPEKWPYKLSDLGAEIRALEVSKDGDAVAITVALRANVTYATGAVAINGRINPEIRGNRVTEWRATYYWRLPQSPTYFAKPDAEYKLTLTGWGPRAAPDQPIDWTRSTFTAPHLATSISRDGRGRYGFNAISNWDHPEYYGQLSPSGEYLVADAGADRHTRIYRIYQRNEVKSLNAGTGPITALAVSQTGDRLISSCSDGKLCEWNFSTGGVSRHDRSGPYNCAVAANDKWFALGSNYGFLLYENSSFRHLEHGGPRASGESVAPLPDGKHVVTGYGDGSVRVWFAANGKLVRSFPGFAAAPGPAPHPAVGAVEFAAAALGHIGPVMGVAAVSVRRASGPEVLVFSGGLDGTLRTWNFTQGTLEAVTQAHAGGVRCVATDGVSVYTGGTDGVLRKWNPADLTSELVSGPKDDGVSSDSPLALSADGRYLVGVEGGQAKLWDTKLNKVVRTVGRKDWTVTTATLSPDGKYLALRGYQTQRALLTLIDLATGESIYTPEQMQSLGAETTPSHFSLYGMMFSPDGKYLVVGNRLIDTLAGRVSRVFKSDGDWDGTPPNLVSYSVGRFSQDGKRVALFRDGVTQIRNVETGAILSQITGGYPIAYPSAFSPTLDRVAGAGYQGFITVRDAATGEQLLSWKGHVEDPNPNIPISTLAFTADGRRLISSGTDGQLRIWDAYTGRELLALPNGAAVGELIKRFAVSAHGSHFAAIVGKDVRVWRTPDEYRPGLVASRPAHRNSSIRFSADGKFGLLLRFEYRRSDRVEVTDLTTGLTVDESTVPERDRLRLYDGRLRLRLPPKEPLRQPDNTPPYWIDDRDEPNYPGSSVVTPDGKRVLMLDGTHRRKNLCVYDVDRKQYLALRKFPGGDGHFQLLACHPDGTKVVAAAPDGTVRLWAIPDSDEQPDLWAEDFPEVKELSRFRGHSNHIRHAAFSPDGRFLVSGGDDCTVHVWDLTTGEVHKVYWLTEPVQLLAFSPDGAWLAVASSNAETSSVGVWNTATWQKQHTFLCTHREADKTLSVSAAALTFSADSQHVRVISVATRLHEWDVRTGRPVRRPREWPGQP